MCTYCYQYPSCPKHQKYIDTFQWAQGVQIGDVTQESLENIECSMPIETAMISKQRVNMQGVSKNDIARSV